MWKTHSFKSVLAITGILMILSSCKQEDIVHQKSLAELNTKAQQMLASGDVNGAVSRLEAAHDLSPNESNTTFNLAIAYQAQGNYDKAIALFKELLDKPGQDQGELYKNLGIAYEAKADALSAKDQEMDENPKSDASQVTAIQSEMVEAYQLAQENYEKAVGKVKDSDKVQKQIELIHARLEHPEGPPPSSEP